MVIIRDDEISFTVHRAFKNAVIVWIGRDIKSSPRRDYSARPLRHDPYRSLDAIFVPPEIRSQYFRELADYRGGYEQPIPPF